MFSGTFLPLLILLCVHLCVEDKDLCSELSDTEEKDVGHKVCTYVIIGVVIIVVILAEISTIFVIILIIVVLVSCLSGHHYYLQYISSCCLICILWLVHSFNLVICWHHINCVSL